MSLLNRLLLRIGPSPQPSVFVTGMPKSGTTAVLRLMGLASGESTLNDPFYQLDMRGIEYRDALFAGQLSLTSVMRRYPRVFRAEIQKDPNYIFFYEELVQAFPDASWVFTIRDPRDNIRSILNRLRLPGRVSVMAAQLDDVQGAWRRVLDGRSPTIEGSDPIERMARRWVHMAQVIKTAGERGVVSRYEDFVKDKQTRITHLCSEVGLEAIHDIAEHVDTQFQPKGDRRAVWSDFFGPDELATIERTCGAWLHEFGYPQSVPTS